MSVTTTTPTLGIEPSSEEVQFHATVADLTRDLGSAYVQPVSASRERAVEQQRQLAAPKVRPQPRDAVRGRPRCGQISWSPPSTFNVHQWAGSWASSGSLSRPSSPARAASR